MSDQVTEVPEVTAGVKAAPEETEATLEQFKKAADLGRGVIQEVRERDNARLTPYLNPEGFRDENLAFLAEDPGEGGLTPEAILEAKRASFGIVLEAAAQIAEVQIPKQGQVREDLDSLERLIRYIKAGDLLREDLIRENPGIVGEQARNLVAKRLSQSPDQLEMTGKQLVDWAEEQFQNSVRRLSRSTQALEGYFGR